MDTKPINSWAVGWSAFAGCMLFLGGAFEAIAGIVAIVNKSFYVAGQEWLFDFDVTVWGWIHLIWGIVLMASGVGIFRANVAARTVGVAVAGVSAIANFAWLPYYPVWSVLMIAIAVTVIWSLTVHGSDIARP